MSVTALLNPVYDLSLLSTGFVPDDTETRLLKAKIVEQKETLTQMNTGLQDLKLRVQKLGDQISDAEEVLKLYEAFLSPSRRLGPETLGQVFMHCLPTDDAVVTINPILAPLLLTHVSRRWQHVAYGTPHLWERLFLGRGFAHRLCALVPLWLKNSGAIPLDIHSSLQDWHSNSDHRLLERNLVNLLLPGVCRCRSLESSMSTVGIEILFGLDLLMPYLEKLDVCLPVWSSLVIPKMGNLQAPRLQNIMLHDTGFLTYALSGPFPMVHNLQLTGQETIGLLSHSRCLDFIALCPNLRSCTLTLSKDPGTLLRSPILLDSLCNLHLIFQFSPHDPIPFLEALHTPRIERLTLQNHGGVSPIPHIRRVLGMLLSSRPQTIKELNLSSLFVPTSDWVPSLHELTELTSLSIIGDSLDEYFFGVLTANDPLDPWICPKLTILKLHHVTGLLGLSGDRLVAFIRSHAPLPQDVPMEIGGNCRYLGDVSLVHCVLEDRHKEELRDIERECGGALQVHGLENASGTTFDMLNLFHPETMDYVGTSDTLTLL